MKKSNYVLLNLLLASILIVLGILIEIQGHETAEGMPIVFMVLPGVSFIVCLLLERVNFKNLWIRLAVYGAIIVVADLVVIIARGIQFSTFGMVLGLIGSMIIATAINIAFYLIFAVIKKKPGLLQVK